MAERLRTVAIMEQSFEGASVQEDARPGLINRGTEQLLLKPDSYTIVFEQGANGREEIREGQMRIAAQNAACAFLRHMPPYYIE